MIELLQFRHSPYNEKVRWALDLKRVPHRRRSLLPGPHMAKVKKLTRQTATPVLINDGEVITDSACILDWLEARYPEPRLIPAAPDLCAAAMALQREFDEDITPRIRCAVLDALLANRRYFARIFAEAESPLSRGFYACIVPLAAPLVRKGNGISGPAAVEEGIAAAHAALDRAATQAATTGFLVGKEFSIADITVAAALATVVRPDNSPMYAPRPVAPAFAALMARFARHPGADWVRGIYAKRRVASADFEGTSPY